MPLIDFSRLKQLVSVPTVLQLHGWRWTVRSGGVWRGPCPIHHSTRPRSRSFACTETGYYCHKCKSNGDALRLHAALTMDGVYAAAIDLCYRLGMDVPYLPAVRDSGNRKRNGKEE